MVAGGEILGSRDHLEKRLPRGIAHADDLVPLLLGSTDEDELLPPSPHEARSDLDQDVRDGRGIALIGSAPAQILFRFGLVRGVARLRAILEQVDHDDRPSRASAPAWASRKSSCPPSAKLSVSAESPEARVVGAVARVLALEGRDGTVRSWNRARERDETSAAEKSPKLSDQGGKVRGEVDEATGHERPGDVPGEVLRREPPATVTTLRPRVREVDVVRSDGVV